MILYSLKEKQTWDEYILFYILLCLQPSAFAVIVSDFLFPCKTVPIIIFFIRWRVVITK